MAAWPINSDASAPPTIASLEAEVEVAEVRAELAPPAHAEPHLFTCESCGRMLPSLAEVGYDGDFIENYCPSCYHDLLYLEHLIPNEFEARRMHECQAAIDAFDAARVTFP